MKTIAIIGPTASGKSDLAIYAAEKLNGIILSLDSLSIYKEIDIASAKPPPEELARAPHYGINVLYPNEPFNVKTFIDLYTEANNASMTQERPLIIVGGTSFYLKALIDGISEIPEISQQTRDEADAILQDQSKAYDMMNDIDAVSMHKIDPNDRYRTQKMLQLYLQTKTAPSQWFAAHPPQPILTDYTLYDIDMPRDLIRQRIAIRTQKMIDTGLVEEVEGLKQRYSRQPNAMKAIGIAETLQYLDGTIDLNKMHELINVHTGQLAKRQQTFNRNQFTHKSTMKAEQIKAAL